MVINLYKVLDYAPIRKSKLKCYIGRKEGSLMEFMFYENILELVIRLVTRDFNEFGLVIVNQL